MILLWKAGIIKFNDNFQIYISNRGTDYFKINFDIEGKESYILFDNSYVTQKIYNAIEKEYLENMENENHIINIREIEKKYVAEWNEIQKQKESERIKEEKRKEKERREQERKKEKAKHGLSIFKWGDKEGALSIEYENI